VKVQRPATQSSVVHESRSSQTGSHVPDGSVFRMVVDVDVDVEEEVGAELVEVDVELTVVVVELLVDDDVVVVVAQPPMAS
jgi:hypothetical protein